MDEYLHCANCTEPNLSFSKISPVKFRWSWQYNFCNTKCKEELMNKVLAYYGGKYATLWNYISETITLVKYRRR